MNLIVGASGVLGSRVLRQLVREGEDVRAISRDRRTLAFLAERRVDAVRGDLLETAWMDPALRGVERVVIAAHGLSPASRRNVPAAVDGDGARRLVDAAARAGVAHVVYVSVAAADRGATAYARVKAATEEHLRASGVPWTIVRPTTFIEGTVADMAAAIRRRAPVTFHGAGIAAVNWISADDVATDIVRALRHRGPSGTVRELRGPEVRSRLAVLEIVERILGETARRRHVPIDLVRAVASLARSALPGSSALLELAVVEDRGGARHQWSEATWTGIVTVEDVVRRVAARFPTIITTTHGGMATA